MVLPPFSVAVHYDMGHELENGLAGRRTRMDSRVAAPPPNLSRGLTAIAVRPRFVSALSPCKTGTCADSLAENVWLPEKAFSGVFALRKRRNPFSFSVFSLRVKVMAIITTVREPILVLFFSARAFLSREQGASKVGFGLF